MIKINLANSILKKSDSKGGSALPESAMIRDAAIKVALIIIPVIGFKFYERNDLEKKSVHLQQLVIERDKVTEELKSMGSVDEIVKQVEEQKKELADKFNVMKQIFGLRAQKIQTLALLQKYIPQSCWLEKVELKESGSMEQSGFSNTVVEVSGSSRSIDDIQNFTSSLNLEKSIFQNVRAPDITAQDGGKSDVKQFKFEIKLKE
jgi:Tfp pilus assembly protein PilN